MNLYSHPFVELVRPKKATYAFRAFLNVNTFATCARVFDEVSGEKGSNPDKHLNTFVDIATAGSNCEMKVYTDNEQFAELIRSAFVFQEGAVI